jgi:rhodanese-related sulfurtransferase
MVISEYFDKAPSSEFHPVKNINLFGVDTYRYDEAWELEADSPTLRSFMEDLDTVLLDLRDARSSEEWSPKPQNKFAMPLFTLSPDQASPFYNSRLLELQWRELDQIFADNIDSRLPGKTVVALCHHGDTARIAASVLRARGVTCFSMKGGARAREPRSRVAKKVDSPMRETSMEEKEEICLTA